MSTTVTAGSTSSFSLGPFDTITVTAGNSVGAFALTSIVPKLRSDTVLTAANGTYGPWGAPMDVVLAVTSGSVVYTVTRNSVTADQAAALDSGTILAGDGTIYALAETSPYVTLTATGTAFTGACELAGWYCSVAAGNITIYDATSATGTPIVPATALVAGPMPIFGAGTNGKLALTTGCHVVLSGAATVRVLVA